MNPINKAINLYGAKRELNITQLYIYCIQNATLLRWFLMEIIRKELSEKNFRAIANLIIDSKKLYTSANADNKYFYSFCSYHHNIVCTNSFWQRVFKLDFFDIFPHTLKNM